MCRGSARGAELGALSVSPALRDVAASRAFCEKLGLTVLGGNRGQHGPILRNGTTPSGLSEGMFEQNLLTFTPGRDGDARPLPACADVSEIQRRPMALGLAPSPQADAGTSGPARCVVEDPDGNRIRVDPHL